MRGIDEESGETIPKLREQIKSIAKVDIMKDENTFKSTFEQLREMSTVYDTLSDKNKAFLQELVAGKHQGNVFASIMQNMSDGVKAMETAQNSTGSAIKEQEAYMNSISAKINEFKENAKSLALDTINSDSIKNIISTGTSALSVLNTLVNKLGAFNTIIGIGALGLSTFSKNFRGLMNNTIGSIPVVGNLSNRLKMLTNTIEAEKAGALKAKEAIILKMQSMNAGSASAVAYGSSLQALNMKITALTVKEVIAKATTIALQTAMTFGLSIAISGLIKGFDYLIHRNERIAEKQQELADNVKQATDEFKGQMESIQNVSNLVAKQEQIMGKNKDASKLSAEAKKELHDIELKIAELLPESAVGYDGENNKISDNIELTKELIKQKKEEAKVKAMETIGDVDVDKQIKLMEKAQEEINRRKERMKNNTPDKPHYNEDMIQQDSKAIAEQNKILINGRTVLNGYNLAVQTLTDAGYDNYKMVKNSKLGVTDLSKTLEKNTDTKKENTEVTKENANAHKDEIKSFEDYQKIIDKSTSNIKDYNSIINDLDKNGSLSSDGVAKIISQFPDLLNYLDDEKKLRTEIMKKIEDEVNINAKAIFEMKKDDVDYYNAKIKGKEQEVNEFKKAYNIDLKGYGDLASAKLAVDNELIKELSKKWEGYFSVLSDGQAEMNYNAISMAVNGVEGSMSRASISIAKEVQADINKYNDKYKEVSKKFKDITLGDTTAKLRTLGIETDKNTSKNKHNTEAVNRAKEAVKAYENQLKKLEAQMAKIDIQLGHLNDHSDAYINKLKEKKKLIQDEINLNKQQIGINRQLASSMPTQSSYSGGGRSSGGSYSGKYANYINEASRRYGVSPALIAGIIQAESGFNPSARSGVGAQGLMQLMPGTARGLGVTNAYDPYQNIMGGTKYIAQQLQAFGGSIEKALAAYNAGAGNVRKYGGIPPFKETQNYVRNVKKYMGNYGGSSSNSRGATNTHSVINEELDLLGKATDLEKKNIELQEQLHKLDIDILNSKLGQFDDRIQAIDNQMSYYKSWQEHYFEKNDSNRLFLANKIEKEMNNKISELNSKRDFVEKSIRSGIYDPKTITDLNNQIKQINGSIMDTQSELRTLRVQIIDMQYTRKVEGLNNEIEKLQQNMEQIQAGDTFNKEQLGNMDSMIDKMKERRKITEDYIKQLQNELAIVVKRNKVKLVEDDIIKREALEEGIDKLKQQLHDLNTEIIKSMTDRKNLIKDLTFEIEKLDEFNRVIEETNENLRKHNYLLADLDLQIELLKEKMDFEGVDKLYGDYISAMNGKIVELRNQSKELSSAMDGLQKEFKLKFGVDISSMSKKDLNNLYQSMFATRVTGSKEEKEALEKQAELFKRLMDDYYQLTEAIQENGEALGGMTNDILKKQKEQADYILNLQKELQDKAKDMMLKHKDDEKKILDERLKNFKEFIDKRQKELDKTWKQEDYDRDLQKKKEEEAKIIAEIASKSRVTDLQGRAEVKRLEEELAKLQEDISNFERDHNRDMIKENLNDQLEKAEKENEEANKKLDEFYSDKNLNQMSYEAIAKGYFKDIHGNTIMLKDAMIDYIKTTSDGLSVIGQKIQDEIIAKLIGLQQFFKDGLNFGGISNIGTPISNPIVMNPIGGGIGSNGSIDIGKLIGGSIGNIQPIFNNPIMPVPIINTPMNNDKMNKEIKIYVDSINRVDGNVYDRDDIMKMMEEGGIKSTEKFENYLISDGKM